MKISIIIASRNEGEELAVTVENVREVCPDAEIVVVDDASTTPEPVPSVRNRCRMGVARSRAIGFSLSTGDVCGFIDGHMHMKKGAIERVAQVALERNGFAYAGCNGHASAELRRTREGLFTCKWAGCHKEVTDTTGMMGAFYFAPRDVLMRLGGWIQLPGHWGMDEEAMSILAAKCGVPIVNVPDVDNWHLFRGQKGSANVPVPYTLTPFMLAVNVAATHRFLFGDAAWMEFREALKRTTDWCGTPIEFGENVLRAVETPAFLRYGEQLRERMTVSDAEFLSRWKEAA